MSEHYLLLKVVHVISATILFGTGIGTAFHMWYAHRSGNIAAIAHVARHVVLADFMFTTPAAIVQPATGVLLALAAGYDLLSPWLICSYILFALAGACWLPVVAIQISIRNLSTDAFSLNAPLPALYHRLMKIWFLLGWPAFIGLMAVFWLMVAKPALW